MLRVGARATIAGVSEAPDWRLAGPEDVEAIVALVRRAYRGDASRAGWTSEADLVAGRRTDPEAIARVVRDDRVLMLVVDSERALRACVQLTDAGDGVAWLGTFAVDPSLQGAGTGGALLEAACALAAQRLGARVVRIKVLEPQAALLAFYERRGFVRTGRLEPFGEAGDGDDRPLVPGLRFVELARGL
jgi:ribosomal protein S18 acetylase RimI-like enzyme